MIEVDPRSRRAPAVPPVTGMLYGGDYNPEQWPEETWLEDVALMREAGVNIVSVGIFSWALLEPEEEVYDFAWLDRVIELLWSNGIAIDLATPTAAPPAWLVRRYPEVLPVTADGVRLEFGSRRHACPSSPVFREASVRIADRLARRYGGHPALALWHVSNEFGCHLPDCYCEVSAAHFRRWLEDRYGSVAELNRVWGTAFWGQRYGSFAEVAPPRRTPASINPTQALDWRRFSSDALLECYEAERDAITASSPGVPVTTNFMCRFQPADYWKWAGREDVVTLDSYPDPSDPEAHVQAALDYDLARSLAGDGRPWLLLEHATGAVNWRPVNVPKRPGQMRLWAQQAVARGSDGAMFFQWRAARAGAEKHHSGMLPHAGRAARGWAETVALGADLRALAEVAGTSVEATVALLFDWENWWAFDGGDHPSQLLDLQRIVLDWYRPLHAANVAVDVVHPARDLSRYRLVVAPNLYLATDDVLRSLAEYAENGGVLAVGYFSGVVDEHDHIRGEDAMRRLLGLRVDEAWPLVAGASAEVVFGSGAVSTATWWTEWLEPDGAETLATYADAPLAGLPAVTRHELGAGRVHYCSAGLDPAGMAEVVRAACADAAVEPVADVPPGVEACRRSGDGRSYLFLLNHAGSPVEVTGVGDGTPVKLDPFGVAVVRER
jgi:beta-galactosidase